MFRSDTCPIRNTGLLLVYAAFLSSALSQAGTITAPQNPYFREIVTGRCYENPPNNQDASLCPFAVDSLVSVLDGRLEQDTTAESFFMYWTMANFDSPRDSALLVWPPPSSAASLPLSSTDLVLPETTLGGALVNGLIFCGVDQRPSCPVEYWKQTHQGALSSFWQGVYSLFSDKIQGHLQIMILEDITEIPALWNNYVIPSLNATFVTEIEILAADCSSQGISDLSATLEEIKNITTSCVPTDRDSPYSKQGFSHQASKINGAENRASASEPAVTCQCHTDTVGLVYEGLFWSLILILSGCAYAYWSVRHYLPEYQRIPNIPEHELTTDCHTNLPKQ